MDRDEAHNFLILKTSLLLLLELSKYWGKVYIWVDTYVLIVLVNPTKIVDKTQLVNTL